MDLLPIEVFTLRE